MGTEQGVESHADFDQAHPRLGGGRGDHAATAYLWIRRVVLGRSFEGGLVSCQCLKTATRVVQRNPDADTHQRR